MPNNIVDFYLHNAEGPQGLTFDACLNMTDEELEARHDYIQWLFPLREGRKQPRLTIMDVINLGINKRGTYSIAVHNQARAFRRMLAFYGFEMVGVTVVRTKDFHNRAQIWLTENSHNYLRITRILKSLCLFDNTHLAGSFCRALLLTNAPLISKQHWVLALQ